MVSVLAVAKRYERVGPSSAHTCRHLADSVLPIFASARSHHQGPDPGALVRPERSKSGVSPAEVVRIFFPGATTGVSAYCSPGRGTKGLGVGRWKAGHAPSGLILTVCMGRLTLT